MTLLVPANIMIPEEGTVVLCYGIDIQNQRFTAVVGRRSGGDWILENNLPFQKVTHWTPVTDELPVSGKQGHGRSMWRDG